MKATYDKSVNAVYIYLADYIPAGSVDKTYSCDPIEVGGMINLDFDKSGRLIGIEIQEASKKLPIELLNQSELIK